MSKRWTAIRKINSDAPYEAFLRIYDLVVEEILKTVPAEKQASCKIAFAEPETCYLLYRKIRTEKCKVILETGTFLGLSALICGWALRENLREYGVEGRIYSISLNSFYRVDRPLEHARKTAENLNLEKFVTLIEGSSGPMSLMSGDGDLARSREEYLERIASEGRENLLPKLTAILGSVDMAFLDGVHYEAYVMGEISVVLAFLSPTGSLFIDDMLINNRRQDLKSIISDLMTFDWSIYRAVHFVRCGFRFYSPSWIVEAFRWSPVANVTIFKHSGKFMRSIELRRSEEYRSHYGPLSMLRPEGSLLAFLDKFEFRPSLSGSRP